MSTSCRICSGTLEYQEASGDTVCTVCGAVAEESNIIAAVEFVENGGGATSVVGQYLSATASRPYGSSGPGYGPSKESREVSIYGIYCSQMLLRVVLICRTNDSSHLTQLPAASISACYRPREASHFYPCFAIAVTFSEYYVSLLCFVAIFSENVGKSTAASCGRLTSTVYCRDRQPLYSWPQI